jgi:hypothetical protein
MGGAVDPWRNARRRLQAARRFPRGFPIGEFVGIDFCEVSAKPNLSSMAF